MTTTTIIQGTQLAEHFRAKVQSALARQSLAASELSEYYLVNLLQEFRDAEKLFLASGNERSEKPLAILLLEALEGDTGKRTRCLKQLGDTALYVSGFFADTFRRRLIDQHYYIAMGGSAYESLAAMFAHEKTFGELYAELAKNFSGFVNILAEVAPWNEAGSNIDLLRLYERWLATGDERLKAALARQGIAVDEQPTVPAKTLQ